ncbi:MAG: hypothetical protein PHH26_01180 [Candidatus Thermoplasmatota archaeon]|nr:hypothetical protein [Candidatus Thermoplasmatota archaeon]
MDGAETPKMKLLPQIILAVLLAISAGLYIAGVVVSTKTTALDSTMLAYAGLVAGSVVIAIIAAPQSVLYTLMLFGIYACGAFASLFHGIQYVEALAQFQSMAGLKALAIIVGILLLAGFAALSILIKGCRSKERIEKYCREETWHIIPQIVAAFLVFIFGMISMGNWIAYQASDVGKALLNLKIGADFMAGHVAFEIISMILICATVFWIQRRKLWCRHCIANLPEEKKEEAPAPVEETKAESVPALEEVIEEEKPKEKKPFFVFALFKKKPKEEKEAEQQVCEAPLPAAAEPDRRKGIAFSFTKKDKLVVVGTEPIGEKKGEECAEPAAAIVPPVLAMEEKKGPVCPSCGKELYLTAYRCPHCNHYQEFGICPECKSETTVCGTCGKIVLMSDEKCSCGSPIIQEIQCEKCNEVYHIEVWKGIRPPGPICSSCKSELYFTVHDCPECGAQNDFQTCTKCGMEHLDDGSKIEGNVKCKSCGAEFEFGVWTGKKPKPYFCPICGREAKMMTVVCPECGQESKSRFCASCNDLVTKCLECGAINMLHDKTCRGCNKPFGTPYTVCPKCGLRIGNPMDYVKK